MDRPVRIRVRVRPSARFRPARARLDCAVRAQPKFQFSSSTWPQEPEDWRVSGERRAALQKEMEARYSRIPVIVLYRTRRRREFLPSEPKGKLLTLCLSLNSVRRQADAELGGGDADLSKVTEEWRGQRRRLRPRAKQAVSQQTSDRPTDRPTNRPSPWQAEAEAGSETEADCGLTDADAARRTRAPRRDGQRRRDGSGR